MGLKEVFEEAATRVKELPSCSNEDQLELYKNYKQANVGDCNTGKSFLLFRIVLNLT